MNRKYTLIAILLITLAGALFYVYGGSQTPTGQPPLRTLTNQNVDVIKDAFNAAEHDTRVLLLLSPT
jgi:hypothetical protein